MIVDARTAGEDLLWSNEDGFVSPESDNVSKFNSVDVGSLTLPIDGRWFTQAEFDECHQARLCLEGLPCPVCTESLTILDLQYILKNIEQLAISMFGRPLDLSNEDEDALWWSELEDWAVRQFRAPYYEDMAADVLRDGDTDTAKDDDPYQYIQIAYAGGDAFVVKYLKSSGVSCEEIEDAFQSFVASDSYEDDMSDTDIIDTVMDSFNMEWSLLDMYTVVI